MILAETQEQDVILIQGRKALVIKKYPTYSRIWFEDTNEDWAYEDNCEVEFVGKGEKKTLICHR